MQLQSFHSCAVFGDWHEDCDHLPPVCLRRIQTVLNEEREDIMFRRTLLGTVAVLALVAMSGGSAFANHGWGGGGGHHHHGGYGYRGGYGYGGGYGYRPMVVAPRVVVAPRPVIMAPPAYGYGYAPGYPVGGCNNGVGTAVYGYGTPYGAGIGYSSPGFGVYVGR